MTNQIIPLYPAASAAQQKRQKKRSRYELLSFLVEAFVTVGIMISFLICAVVFLCIV